jgi:putative acetyltransferase
MIRSVFHEFGVVRPNTVYDDPTTDDLYALFREPGSVLYVVEVEGEIAGSGGVFPTKGLPENCCELVKFYLSPSSRGQGLGKELLSMCMTAAREKGYTMMYLESFPEFVAALGLYRKAGFRFLDKSLGTSGHTGCNVWMIKEL